MRTLVSKRIIHTAQRCALALYLSLNTHTALAQNQPNNKARAAFEQAEAYYRTRDFEKALELYKEAYLLSKEPSMLYNMGQCYRRLGKLQEAIDMYAAFLRDVDDTHPLYEKAMTLLTETKAELDAKKITPNTQPTSEPSTRPTSLPATTPTKLIPETNPTTTPTSTSLPTALITPPERPEIKPYQLFYGSSGIAAATALILGGIALREANAAAKAQDQKLFSEIAEHHDRAVRLGVTSDLLLASSGALLYVGLKSPKDKRHK